MKVMTCLFSFALLTGAGVTQDKPVGSWDDETLWADFTDWAAALKPLPPGETAISTEWYEARLRDLGASDEQAKSLMTRLQAHRRGSPERELIYWNARFKLGGGPDQPLPLLAETLQRVAPGRALDVAMGRGRNSIYLASIGWDVTGYDLSPEALEAAQRYAEKSQVHLQTIEAAHDTFEFGEEQWDLIVCSYAYMQPHEAEWPGRLFRALRPGGTVVIQTSWKRQATLGQLLELWQPLRIVRYEDLDAGAIDNDWPPSKTNPTVKLVLRKDVGSGRGTNDPVRKE